MSFRRKRVQQEENVCLAQEREERLRDAENRVNVLVQTAEWIHTAVARRDQDNHWQDSVDRLFLGGQA